jgi:hypothetical protein
MPNENQNLPAVQFYTPVELVGIYRSFIERGKSNNVVRLQLVFIQRVGIADLFVNGCSLNFLQGF